MAFFVSRNEYSDRLLDQASGPLQIGTVVEGTNIPDVESDSTPIADDIDVPVCFVEPNERFESS